TGGGNVHTYELALFLTKAGYNVRHLYARYDDWGVGTVETALPYASEELACEESTWNQAGIKTKLQKALKSFDPDHVIITDSWNSKPFLAEACSGFPYILRFQAMECLCPLNNVRLLPEAGRFRQCRRHQLDNPAACRLCVEERGPRSGSLHQAERALSEGMTPEYRQRLLRALRDAEALLVVNPLTAAMLGPYAKTIRVVTAGMDPARFPWPGEERAKRSDKAVLFFAGLVDEWMKGFEVLHEACA